jgi:Restriction endonuclease
VASIPQIRGALLEEIVMLLLKRSGYRQVRAGEEGTRLGASGLEVKGRGSWHQIDAFVAPLHSHAFIHPIRLIVEAKCYEERTVDIRTIRAIVGTLMDIGQNYFSEQIEGMEVQVQRFNYHAALFSTTGYSTEAQQYAAAHQVFLIEYTNIPTMVPVVRALFTLDEGDFTRDGATRLHEIRQGFRDAASDLGLDDMVRGFTELGRAKLRDLLPAVRTIAGSYFGMIEGIYAVHLLATHPIPPDLLMPNEPIRCRIRVSGDNRVWAFEPSGSEEGSPRFFRLEFQIPVFIAEILAARGRRAAEERQPEWLEIAQLKGERLRFVDVTGPIGERIVTFRLILDTGWLQEYINSRREQ